MGFDDLVSTALGQNYLRNIVAPTGAYGEGGSFTWLPVVDKEAGETTSNVDVADESVDKIMEAINSIPEVEIVGEPEPGMAQPDNSITLLGYSDGAAMILAFLGRAQQRGLDVSRIKRVVFVKGYVEGERHQGLDFSNAEFVPFEGIDAYFVAGQNDDGFYQSTLDAQAYFNNPETTTTPNGHELELPGVAEWIKGFISQPEIREELPNIPEGVNESAILKGAIAVEGYYPLFEDDEEMANAASPEGTSHVHTFDGIPSNYYMPNGLVMEGPGKNGWHGDFPGENWNPDQIKKVEEAHNPEEAIGGDPKPIEGGDPEPELPEVIVQKELSTDEDIIREIVAISNYHNEITMMGPNPSENLNVDKDAEKWNSFKTDFLSWSPNFPNVITSYGDNRSIKVAMTTDGDDQDIYVRVGPDHNTDFDLRWNFMNGRFMFANSENGFGLPAVDRDNAVIEGANSQFTISRPAGLYSRAVVRKLIEAFDKFYSRTISVVQSPFEGEGPEKS